MRGRIFSTDQVRAIQDGRMTQFMQEVKQDIDHPCAILPPDDENYEQLNPDFIYDDQLYCANCGHMVFHNIKCPFGKVGDVIYVREGWHYWDGSEQFVYKEDPPFFFAHEKVEVNPFKSPATMPREAARLFLRIENIRVMTVQDLTEEDALKQGYEVIHEELCPALCALKSEVFEKGLEYIYNFHWIIDFTKTDKP